MSSSTVAIPAQAAPHSPARAWVITPSLAREICALTLGAAMTLVVNGYQIGQSNHTVYLADAIHRLDPTLLANDWFTTQTLQYHSVFGWVTRALAQAGFVREGFLVGYLMCVAVMHLAWRRLIGALAGRGRWGGGDGTRTYLLSVLLFYCCAGGTGLGAYAFLQDGAFLPSNVANVAMLAAIAAALAGNSVWAGVWLGTAGLFHLNHAVFAIPLWLAYSAAVAGERHAIGRRWLIGTLILAALTAANAIPALRALPHGPGLPLAEFVNLYVRVRHPHHYDPSSWPAILWVFALLPMVAGSAVLFARRRAGGIPAGAWRRAAYLFAAIVAAQAIALTFAGATYVSERLVQLSLYRFSIFAMLLGCAMAAWWLVGERRGANAVGRWTGPFMLMLMFIATAIATAGWAGNGAREYTVGHPGHVVLAIAVSAGLVLASEAAGRRAILRPSRNGWLAGAVIALCLPAAGWGRWLGNHVIPEDPPGHLALCDWAEANTPRDAIFLVPPGEQAFRVRARRAVVVNFKGVPQLSPEILAWRTRLCDVLGLSPAELMLLPTPFPDTLDAIGAIYDARPPADLEAVARRYGARYVIARRPVPAWATREVAWPRTEAIAPRLYDLDRR